MVIGEWPLFKQERTFVAMAGVMMDASIPGNGKWIPQAMTVNYLARTKTDLRAIAAGDGIDWDGVKRFS
ncbi:DUF4442 domain-containing protein [Marinobacter nauticus]|uniref:Uncharacterized protein n=1 Tax=Marinobacter nauticus TaxID=2743 RepID=A0A1M2URR0_MARNT|nr:DUF4442 domain-containing protein [Marinobacter nauticus]OJS98009.1 hypothetical protein BEE62_16970 [Marinobacter nauticus]